MQVVEDIPQIVYNKLHKRRAAPESDDKDLFRMHKRVDHLVDDIDIQHVHRVFKVLGLHLIHSAHQLLRRKSLEEV